MAGFPLSHLDRHLRTLVQTHGRCVALCEEFPRPDGSFERRVARIVTPGTLIDEPFVDAHTNNYLLAVTRQDADELGLAWIDVSTGEFFAKSSSLAGLRDELARLAPKEVVLELELGDQPEHPLRTMLAEEGAFVAFLAPTAAEQQLAVPVLHDELGTDSDDLTDDSKGTASLVDAHSPAFSLAESSAIALLTSFLSSHLLENMPHLGLPRRDAGQQRMRIDASTLAALELTTRGGAGSADGSLLSAVRRTVTAGGARLLARWLAAPSTHAPEIAARHALVGLFRARPHLRADLRAAARGAPDAPRLLQRLAARRGGPPDLASLHAALGTWAALRTRIALERDMEAREKDGVRDPDWDALDALVGRMAPLEELGRKIDMALQRTTLTVEAVAEAESVVDELGGTADSGVEDTFAVGSPARWSINPE
jgi:DNA mismatch repair ATPase MutS